MVSATIDRVRRRLEPARRRPAPVGLPAGDHQPRRARRPPRAGRAGVAADRRTWPASSPTPTCSGDKLAALDPTDTGDLADLQQCWATPRCCSAPSSRRPSGRCCRGSTPSSPSIIGYVDHTVDVAGRGPGGHGAAHRRGGPPPPGRGRPVRRLRRAAARPHAHARRRSSGATPSWPACSSGRRRPGPAVAVARRSCPRRPRSTPRASGSPASSTTETGVAGRVGRGTDRPGVAAPGWPVRDGRAGAGVIESMNGARFVSDTLELAGWEVAIADAVKVKDSRRWRARSDRIDAFVPAELSCRDLVPAIWLPGPEVRAQRERARFRLHLVHHRVKLKNRSHATLIAFGHECPTSDLFGTTGRRRLAELALPEPVGVGCRGVDRDGNRRAVGHDRVVHVVPVTAEPARDGLASRTIRFPEPLSRVR